MDLQDIVSKINGVLNFTKTGFINLYVKNNKLIIDCGAIKIIIKNVKIPTGCYNPADIIAGIIYKIDFDASEIPGLVLEKKTEIVHKICTDGIITAIKYASQDISRESLTCIYIDKKNITATDGRVLYSMHHAYDIDSDFLIELKIAMLLKILQIQYCDIYKSKNHLFFENADYIFSQKINQNSYAKYEQVISPYNKTSKQFTIGNYNNVYNTFKPFLSDAQVIVAYKDKLIVKTENRIFYTVIPNQDITDPVGFNAELLNKVYPDITNNIGYFTGNSQIAPRIFVGDGVTILIMPLRMGDSYDADIDFKKCIKLDVQKKIINKLSESELLKMENKMLKKEIKRLKRKR